MMLRMLQTTQAELREQQIAFPEIGDVVEAAPRLAAEEAVLGVAP